MTDSAFIQKEFRSEIRDRKSVGYSARNRICGSKSKRAAKLPSDSLTIINVNIDDMDFEDSYNQAIAQKQISQMNYEQQQIENERSVAAAQAEAEKKVIEANAEADKKRITAEADAEQARIAAQAEADAIKSVADAQAEANRKLAESVTDALIEYEKVKSWDGKLPKVTDGNSLISFGIE